MAYPQYQGGYNPYPGYPGGVSAPSGATAITSGILATIGALGQLISGGAILALGLIDWEIDGIEQTGLVGKGWFHTFAVATGALSLVASIVLGVGSIGLLSRKHFGRVLVVLGCVIVLGSGIVGFAVTESVEGKWENSFTLGGSGLIGLIFPIATAILAMVPLTGRWLAYQPNPVGGYPPAPPSPAQPGAAIPGDQVSWPQPGQPVEDQSWQQAGAAPSGQPQPTWGNPNPAWQQPADRIPQPPSQNSWGQPDAVAPSGQVPGGGLALPGVVPNQVAWSPNSSAPAWGAAGEPVNWTPAAGRGAWDAPAQPNSAGALDDSVWKPTPAGGSSATDETIRREPPAH